MIKNFEEYINEDYFSKLASRNDNNDVRKENGITEDFVMSLVREGYENQIKSITTRKENGKTIVDIDGNYILNYNIEEIPFQFGKVTGDFYCSFCKLTSLEGCPKKVTGDFHCSWCENLKSLEGCPQKVGGDFICTDCGKKFTKEEVKSLCKVKGKILV